MDRSIERRRITRQLIGSAYVALALCGAGCAADPPPPVLSVGDAGYSAQELGALSTAQREQLADLTAFALLVAKGELPRLAAPFVERDRRTLLLRKLALEVSAREAGMDEAALRAAYREAPEYELEVRHVVILAERWRSADERTRARERAETVLRRARAGEDFAMLAAEFSDEPGAAARGGLLRPGRRDTWVAEFWQAASALDVGEISDVVATRYGFHVLELEGRRAVPFGEVRDAVLARLVDEAAAASAADAWVDRQLAPLELRAAAVPRWRAGEAPDSIALATWPDGGYRADEFRRYLLRLTEDVAQRLESAPDSAYLAVVAAAARNALLAGRARAMGIDLSAADSATTARRWHDRAVAWAAALGFREGLTGEALKRSALAALGATDQSARIAREQVLARSRALRVLCPVTLAAPASRDSR